MSAPDERSPQIRPHRLALGVAMALLVAVGLVAVIGRAAGYAEVADTIREGEPLWLLVCAGGQVLVFAAYAQIFRGAVAFEGGPRIGVGLSGRVTVASFGLTQLVAAGGAAALAVTYWALRRLGWPAREALVRLIGLNALVYLVFGLIGWSAALASILLGAAPRGMTIPWLTVIPLLLGAALWFTQAGRVRHWTQPDRGRFRHALAVGVAAAWWVRRAASDPGGRGILLAAAGFWLGGVVGLWGALRAFGGGVGVAPLVLAFTTGYAAQFLPIPFIGTGGVDAATTFALHAVGAPLEQALLAVVAFRLFAFWLPLVPALVLAGLLPATGRRLEAARVPVGTEPGG